MEYLRTKVAIAAILGAVCSFVSAETIETCTEIKDPTTRLACYDNALQKDVPKSVLEPKSVQAPKSTQVPKEAKDLAAIKGCRAGTERCYQKGAAQTRSERKASAS